MHPLHRTARLFLPLALVFALAACDAGAGPELANADGLASPADSPLTEGLLSSSPEWLTFYPGDSGRQEFELEDFEITFEGTDYLASGIIRAALQLQEDGQGGFDVRGHLNPLRLTIETADGASVYRVTGAANFRGNVAEQGVTDTEIYFNVITPGPEPNYRLVLTLSAMVNDDGDGVIAAVTDVQIEER